MTLLERLQSHKGGLLRIRSELYWYDGRGWDNNPGRVCLILGATPATRVVAVAAPAAAAAARIAAVLLLIDCCPQWIWVSEADVEVLEKP